MSFWGLASWQVRLLLVSGSVLSVHIVYQNEIVIYMYTKKMYCISVDWVTLYETEVHSPHPSSCFMKNGEGEVFGFGFLHRLDEQEDVVGGCSSKSCDS